MAKFCTGCGSPLEEGVKFCAKCGTFLDASAGATPTAPTPQPRAPAAAPPPAAQAAPAPRSGGGGTILKIVLAIVGFFVLVSLLGIGACVYIGYRARQKYKAVVAESKKAQITWSTSTPEVHAEKGGEGSEAASAATEDVPPYPGSTATKSGGGISVAGIAMSGQEYQTPDPVDKVVDWYKEKLGSKINVRQEEGKAIFTLTGAHGLSTVTISRPEGAEATTINIARLGK